MAEVMRLKRMQGTENMTDGQWLKKRRFQAEQIFLLQRKRKKDRGKIL